MPASHNRLSENTPLAALVRRARRRRLFQLLLDAGALAFAIAFGGGIVLLVLGTEILDWYWLAVLFTAGVFLGAAFPRGGCEAPPQHTRSLECYLASNDHPSTCPWMCAEPPCH